jgi:cyclic pyranopterin phosphate synthase
METVVRAPDGSRSPPEGVLRLSVTDRCNFRCRYCMPAEGVPMLRHADLLGFERLTETAAWLCRERGVRRIKLTGGEPLVRAGVVDLVRELARIPGVDEVSATTNGSRLSALAPALRSAGLARVNVSIDSLDADRFDRLTRGGRLGDTVAGIDAAIREGLTPVKLNTVLLASSWREDVPAVLDFARRRGLEARFIELMRTGTEVSWAESEFVSAEVVRAELGLDGRPEEGDARSSGPARTTRTRWRGAPIRVGWITPRSHPFCDGCNRLRMDARGRLRRCLMDPNAFELAAALSREHDDVVRDGLDVYLAGKTPSSSMDSALPMVSVGG